MSSYLYLDRFRDDLDNFDYKAELIDKDFPSLTSPDFKERFITPIQTFLNQSPQTTIKAQMSREVVLDDDPFTVSYEKFMEMDVFEKDALALKAQKIAKAILDESYAGGAMWVFMCGSRDTITASASSIKEVFNNDKLLGSVNNQANQIIEQAKFSMDW